MPHAFEGRYNIDNVTLNVASSKMSARKGLHDVITHVHALSTEILNDLAEDGISYSEAELRKIDTAVQNILKQVRPLERSAQRFQQNMRVPI